MTETIKQNAELFRKKANELGYRKITKMSVAFIVGGTQSHGREESLSKQIVKIANKNLPEEEFLKEAFKLVGYDCDENQ